jgi:hypothetical protein
LFFVKHIVSFQEMSTSLNLVSLSVDSATMMKCCRHIAPAVATAIDMASS